MEFIFEINPDKKGVTIHGIKGNLVNLHNLEIPKNISIIPVTHIGSYAFKGAKNLNSVTLPDTIEKIFNGAFSECPNLYKINLPINLIYIGEDAFSRSNNVEILGLPNKLEYIGEYAFSECYGINKLKLPDSLKHIGVRAFASTNINSIEIPEKVNEIGESAFGFISNLQEIKVNQKNKSYSSYKGVLFNKKQTVLMQYPNGKRGNIFAVPKGVKEIAKNAFRENLNLKLISFPNTLKIIGKTAFRGVKSLSKLEIPNSVIKLGRGACSDNKSIKEVVLSNKLTELEDDLFRDAKGIEKLVVPEGVKSLGNDIFSRSSLVEIVLPHSLEKILWDAFYFTSIKKIAIPENVNSIGDSSFSDMYELEEIIVSERNRNYTSLDGVLFNKRKTKILLYPINKSNKQYRIPKQVKTIEFQSFSELRNLNELFIPKNVVKFNEYISRDGYTSDQLTIYAEAEEKPNGWIDDWNHENCPVKWGHK